MTRFRALVVAGVVVLGFTFGGCFDFGGDECKPVAASEGAVGGDGPICQL